MHVSVLRDRGARSRHWRPPSLTTATHASTGISSGWAVRTDCLGDADRRGLSGRYNARSWRNRLKQHRPLTFRLRWSIIARAGADRALEHGVQPGHSVRLLIICRRRDGITTTILLRVLNLLRLGEARLHIMLAVLWPPFAILLVTMPFINRLIILPVAPIIAVVRLILLRLIAVLVVVLLVGVRMVVVPHGASAR